MTGIICSGSKAHLWCFKGLLILVLTIAIFIITVLLYLRLALRPPILSFIRFIQLISLLYSRLILSLYQKQFDFQGQLSLSSTALSTKFFRKQLQCFFASLFAAHSSLFLVHPLSSGFLSCCCLSSGGADWTYYLFWQFGSLSPPSPLLSPHSPLRTTPLMLSSNLNAHFIIY